MSIPKILLGIAAASTTGITGVYAVNKFVWNRDPKENTPESEKAKVVSEGEDTKNGVQTNSDQSPNTPKGSTVTIESPETAALNTISAK